MSKILERVPWGLVIPTAFIGTVAGWFYRNSKSYSNQTAFTLNLKSQLVLAPDEIVQLRDANHLSVSHYRQIVKRTRALPARLSANDFYSHFVPDQLGGEFQARQSLRAGHLFQRLSLVLDGQYRLPDHPSPNLLLAGLAMAVKSDPPKELLVALFDVATNISVSSSPSLSLSRADYETFIDYLMQTNQLPVRVLVTEIDQYPFRTYIKATPGDLVKKTLGPENDSLDQDEFIRLLSSKDVCIWGTCTLMNR